MKVDRPLSLSSLRRACLEPWVSGELVLGVGELDSAARLVPGKWAGAWQKQGGSHRAALTEALETAPSQAVEPEAPEVRQG